MWNEWLARPAEAAVLIGVQPFRRTPTRHHKGVSCLRNARFWQYQYQYQFHHSDFRGKDILKLPVPAFSKTRRCQPKISSNTMAKFFFYQLQRCPSFFYRLQWCPSLYTTEIEIQSVESNMQAISYRGGTINDHCQVLQCHRQPTALAVLHTRPLLGRSC